MASTDDRDELLHALRWMGIELPPRSKLTTDSLDKKLRKALDLSQCIKAEFKGANTLNLSKLKEWSAVSSSPLMESVKTVSVNEASKNFIALSATGSIPAPELFVDPFIDLRQTIMGLGKAFDEGVTISLLRDKEGTHSIILRVIRVCAIDKETPLILVLYDSNSGPTAVDSSPYLLANGHIVNGCKSTVAEQKLLLRALESNGRRLTRDYRPDYLPFESHFKLSFILPFHPLNMVAIGSLTGDIGCAVCGDQRKSKCSKCHSISYCGTDCQRVDWQDHRNTCKSLSKGSWIDVSFHVPVLGQRINNYDNTADFRAIAESLKQVTNVRFGRDLTYRGKDDLDCGQPSPNIHSDVAFLIKIQVPLGSKQDDPDNTIMIYDRRRSFDAYVLQKAEPQKYSLIEYVVRNKGINGLKMYRWAKRTGDWQLSICLDREPSNDIQW